MNRKSLLNVFAPDYHLLFPFLEKTSGNVELAAEFLKQMVMTSDFKKQFEYNNSIAELCRKGEAVYYETYKLIDKLLILPFEKKDINILVTRIDAVTESIFMIARMILSLNSKGLHSLFKQMSESVCDATREINTCIRLLKDFETARNLLVEKCGRLEQIEEEAQEICISGILLFYLNTKNNTQLSKSKMILDLYKNCFRQINLVANAFWTILAVDYKN